MAIENGRLVAGPTAKRDKEELFYVSYVTNTKPGDARIYTDENGNVTSDYQLPQAEGQIAVWQQAGGDPVAQAYVAVSILGALQWVRVVHTLGLQDSSTGAPWDSLSGFYSPLAS